ncbi:IS3 family transposase [Pectinatus frisingensis]|uniref:IS3 family transposase n=1 Tax=Pectinatus frisingensis TaxID=865 RepID=UPI003D803F9C
MNYHRRPYLQTFIHSPLVFEYIETFYNTVRIHSYCGYKSPNQYEQEYFLQRKRCTLNLVKFG